MEVLGVLGFVVGIVLLVEFFHIGWLVNSSRNLLKEILAELRKT